MQLIYSVKRCTRLKRFRIDKRITPLIIQGTEHHYSVQLNTREQEQMEVTIFRLDGKRFRRRELLGGVGSDGSNGSLHRSIGLSLGREKLEEKKASSLFPLTFSGLASTLRTKILTTHLWIRSILYPFRFNPSLHSRIYLLIISPTTC